MVFAAQLIALIVWPEGPPSVRVHVEAPLRPWSLDVADAAEALLDPDVPTPGFRDDCSGFVSAVYTDAGIPMDGRVADLYAIAEARGLLYDDEVPAIGDLAFFDNTHDRNGDGAWNDPQTHIAVVLDVEPDGTIWLAHKGSARARIAMNLFHPERHAADDGTVWNAWLRRASPDDPRREYLTGQLWTSFARVPPRVDWTEGSER